MHPLASPHNTRQERLTTTRIQKKRHSSHPQHEVSTGSSRPLISCATTSSTGVHARALGSSRSDPQSEPTRQVPLAIETNDCRHPADLTQRGTHIRQTRGRFMHTIRKTPPSLLGAQDDICTTCVRERRSGGAVYAYIDIGSPLGRPQSCLPSEYDSFDHVY